ncbi:hypothetical protein GCM10028805_43950 [Spirosoma harenae]
MYQKITLYLFPALCLEAIAWLGLCLFLGYQGEYFWTIVAFFLLLFTDLLILVFDHFLRSQTGRLPADTYF